MGLAPMAVLPEEQRKGIGSALVAAGLQEITEMGHGIVVVLGHPEFYPRFGFKQAMRYGITWEEKIPPEVFMVIELKRGALEGVRGVARFRPEFSLLLTSGHYIP